MTAEKKHYPLIVVGAGHAGCEAALAAARLGVSTLLLTLDLSTIALMPCNPSIGGPGKGHLVREIGALGGEMAACIDAACLQIKWLNVSKGPAVQARRAQADKEAYRRRMLHTLLTTANLVLKQGHVCDVLVKNGRVTGVITETAVTYTCEALVIASGTYLDSRIILGHRTWPGGPQNQRPATALAAALKRHGIPLRRLQTATPPRIHGGNIDFSRLKELPGDPDSGGFTWENRTRQMPQQRSCFLALTDQRVVDMVAKHLPDSPLVLKNITDDGPKHCPSIDRKVLRFPHVTQHQIFIEPEEPATSEWYLQGLTTAMPPAAQNDIVHSVPGLEHVRILRYGYAIEYDAMPPAGINKCMMSRYIGGLFSAGQINGTSGYEEAAAQGLLAGINAARLVLGKAPLLISRTQGYLGVLADDLALWERPEPYRITPGHAEFRLLLRDESAERRLTAIGYHTGLLPEPRFAAINAWIQRIEQERVRLENTEIAPTQALREHLQRCGTGDIKKKVSVASILQRPEVSYADLPRLLPGLFVPSLQAPDEIHCIETEFRYSGYLNREQQGLAETAFLESNRLPLPLLEQHRRLFSATAWNSLIQPSVYEDLGQLVRKRCLSRGELAILVEILQKSADRKELP